MPAFLQAIITALVGLFGAKVAAVTAAAASFTVLTLALTAAITTALNFTVPALPVWAAAGFSLLPAQVPVYVGAYVSSLLARRVYDVSVSALGFRV